MSIWLFTFSSWEEGLGASEASASGSVDLLREMLALPSVIATIIIRPTSPLFSAFIPTLTAWKNLAKENSFSQSCSNLYISQKRKVEWKNVSLPHRRVNSSWFDLEVMWPSFKRAFRQSWTRLCMLKPRYTKQLGSLVHWLL